jgi:hypothetical protein
MHLLESYALNTGLKIDKPYIMEAFFPLASQAKYITFQPYSKESKNYEYWKDVLDLLEPSLTKNRINVMQLGSREERHVPGTYDLRGRTTINQMAYLIKNSVLHLGTDSCAVHIASGYDKKIVALYNIMHPTECGPYWSKKNRVRLLEPERAEGEHPSYSNIESPKTINKIRPEDIARNVAELLDLDFSFPYKTLYMGPKFNRKKVELIPESWMENTDALNIDSLIIRMDLDFNEKSMTQQLVRGPCSIVTNKEINAGLVSSLKKNIREFVYIVDEHTNGDYLTTIKELGVNLLIMSDKEGEDLDDIKLKFLDFGKIHPIELPTKESIKELDGKDIEKLYFRSNTFSIKGEFCYASKDSSFYSAPVENIAKCPIQPVIDSKEFWEESEHYWILEKA